MPPHSADSATSMAETGVPAPRWPNRGVAVLAILGLIVAAYLTLAHLNKLPLSCESVLFDCGKVARHPLAHGLGIPALRSVPTAVLGLCFFAAMAASCLARALAGRSPLGRAVSVARLGLAGMALAVFALLTYAEARIIHAWCPYCVISALLTVGITVLLVIDHARERRALAPPAWRARLGETLRLLAGEALGLLVGVMALWYVKYLLDAPPQLVPELTRAALQLDEAPVMGAPGAPYTLVEFGHYRCPHCKASQTDVEALLHRHDGRLNAVFSPATREPDEQFYLLAGAAAAAARDGKYVEMHRALFARQDAISELPPDAMRAAVLQAAGALGLPAARFQRALDAPEVTQYVRRRDALATQYHLFPLPKFVFLSPTHPPVVLHTTAQMTAWLQDPRHW